MGDAPFDFYTCNSHAAEISLSPNEEFLVLSHRGYDALARYSIRSDGSVHSPLYMKTHGRLPWHFSFLAEDRVVVACQVIHPNGIS